MRRAWLCVGRRYTLVWRACMCTAFLQIAYTPLHDWAFSFIISSSFFHFILPEQNFQQKYGIKMSRKNTQNHISTPKKTPTFASAELHCLTFSVHATSQLFFSPGAAIGTLRKYSGAKIFYGFFLWLVYSKGMHSKCGGKLELT